MSKKFDPITVELDESLHLAFWRLVGSRSVKQIAVYGPVVLGLVLLLGYSFGEKPLELVLPALVGLVVLAVGIASLWFWAWPVQSSKIFNETTALREAQAITIAQNSFTIDQASGCWTQKWNDMVKWDENSAVFAVFPNRYLGYIFPKDQIDIAVIDFARAQLIETGLTKRGALRK